MYSSTGTHLCKQPTHSTLTALLAGSSLTHADTERTLERSAKKNEFCVTICTLPKDYIQLLLNANLKVICYRYRCAGTITTTAQLLCSCQLTDFSTYFSTRFSARQLTFGDLVWFGCLFVQNSTNRNGSRNIIQPQHQPTDRRRACRHCTYRCLYERMHACMFVCDVLVDDR